MAKPEQGTVRIIKLTQGKVALVDDADYEKVSPYKWWVFHATATLWYARAWINGKRVYMHRLLLSPPSGLVTDHINGDGLDNRRSNLRAVTQRKNKQNRGACRNSTSHFRGVSWSKWAKKWVAQIKVDGVSHNLGGYDDEEEAVAAYDAGAKRLLGPEAWVNRRQGAI